MKKILVTVLFVSVLNQGLWALDADERTALKSMSRVEAVFQEISGRKRGLEAEVLDLGVGQADNGRRRISLTLDYRNRSSRNVEINIEKVILGFRHPQTGKIQMRTAGKYVSEAPHFYGVIKKGGAFASEYTGWIKNLSPRSVPKKSTTWAYVMHKVNGRLGTMLLRISSFSFKR